MKKVGNGGSGGRYLTFVVPSCKEGLSENCDVEERGTLGGNLSLYQKSSQRSAGPELDNKLLEEKKRTEETRQK